MTITETLKKNLHVRHPRTVLEQLGELVCKGSSSLWKCFYFYPSDGGKPIDMIEEGLSFQVYTHDFK